MAAAEALAAEILKNPPLAVRANVRVMRWFVNEMQRQSKLYTQGRGLHLTRRLPRVGEGLRREAQTHLQGTMTPMAYQYATYEKQGRIAVVTINRPEVMNALHPPAQLRARRDLERVRSAIPTSGSRIITGAGDKAFSAGNDLQVSRPSRPTAWSAWPEAGFGGLTSRYDLLEADHRRGQRRGAWAAASRWRSPATSSSPPTTPGSACPSRASAYGGRGRRAPPAAHDPPEDRDGHDPHRPPRDGRRRRYELGFVNEVVPPPSSWPTALRLGRARSSRARRMSIRASKQAVMGPRASPLDDGAAQLGYTEAERMRRSEDTIEGPRAFAEKRKPNWKAR